MSEPNFIRSFRRRALSRGYSFISIRKVRFCRDEKGNLIGFDEPVYYVSLCEPLISARLEFVCFLSEFDSMFRSRTWQGSGRRSPSASAGERRRQPVINGEILEAIFKMIG